MNKFKMNTMKKITTFLIVTTLTLCFQSNIFGQTFLNGSFEVTTANCNYGLSNSMFNGMMSNNFAIGSAEQIDIMQGTCGYGTAEQGNYFIGLAVDINNTLTDGVSFKLSSSIVAGNTYLLKFYARKDAAYNANLLEVGYSTDSISFGTSTYTASLPTTSWGLVSFQFTPSINSRFITIRTIAGTYGWNFVDDFTITETTGIHDNSNENHFVHLFPNPTLSDVTINSEKEIASVLVYDFTGKLVRRIEANAFETKIDMTTLAKGFYTFTIISKDSSLKTIKVVRE